MALAEEGRHPRDPLTKVVWRPQPSHFHKLFVLWAPLQHRGRALRWDQQRATHMNTAHSQGHANALCNLELCKNKSQQLLHIFCVHMTKRTGESAQAWPRRADPGAPSFHRHSGTRAMPQLLLVLSLPAASLWQSSVCDRNAGAQKSLDTFLPGPAHWDFLNPWPERYQQLLLTTFTAHQLCGSPCPQSWIYKTQENREFKDLSWALYCQTAQKHDFNKNVHHFTVCTLSGGVLFGLYKQD